MTPVTFTFDLLTLKWCATHRHLMGCVYTTYEVNRSNRDGAMERTRQNFERPLWPWPLTFWPGNGARHILTSWVACVPHMKWIGPIRTERTQPKLRTTPVTLTFDLLTRKWCATHRHLMGCVYTTYEVNRSNRDGATERTRPKLRTTPMTLTFDLLTRKWCATHRHLMGCVYTTYEVNRSNRDGATERTRPKLRTTPVTLTFDLLTRNWCATHYHLMSCVCTTYEVNRSNRYGATERTPKTSNDACDLHLKWPVWPWPLTFWPKNGTRHIIMSWTIFVPSINQIGQKTTEPRSGHDKMVEWPLWPWPLTLWPQIVRATSIS